MHALWQRVIAVPSWLLIAAVRCYQLGISPFIGPRCRFQPTCSQYFIEAVQKYGAIRGSTNGSDGQWIWNVPGGNGKFTVAVGASADITATGMALPAFGTTDLRLTINTTTLAPGFEAFMPANGVKVKSSAWGWSEQTMVDDGTKGDVMAADGIFTMVLSEFVGEGKPLGRLVGLLKTGDEAQFVFVLGGVEYKVAGTPPTQGVAVAVKPQGGAFTDVAVDNKPDGDKNTFVVVP